MSTKSYWDFRISVKNFSASSVIDSRNMKMYDMVTFRNGKFQEPQMGNDSISHLMVYSINYIDIIHNDMERIDITDWLNHSISDGYVVKFSHVKNKIACASIRFYSLDDAFKFKLQFYNYIDGVPT